MGAPRETRLVDGAVELTCDGCGATQRATLGTQPTAREETANPAVATPAPAEAPPLDEGELRARWDELLTRWEEKAAHERFVSACMLAGRLDYAGGCYRARLDAKADDAHAKAGRDVVIARAQALLAATVRTEVSERTRLLIRVTRIALYVVVGIIFIVCIYLVVDALSKGAR